MHSRDEEKQTASVVSKMSVCMNKNQQKKDIPPEIEAFILDGNG